MDNIFTLLVAIVAIASPVITTVLNHRFEIRMHERKHQEKKQATISLFLSELTYISRVNPHEFKGFSRESLEVISYLPKESADFLIFFISQLETRHTTTRGDVPHTFGSLRYEVVRFHPRLFRTDFIPYSDIVHYFTTTLLDKCESK